MSDLILKHNTQQNRYEAWAAESLAGFAEYQLSDSLIVFTHTEVGAAYEGQGVGSQIARYALDDVRLEGSREVIPRCSFIKGWIDRHPEYQQLLHRA